jgi:hypothetical protein
LSAGVIGMIPPSLYLDIWLRHDSHVRHVAL